MKNKQPVILITGGTGFIGSALVQHFSQKGWKVIALVRNTEQPVLPNVTYIAYNLPDNLEELIFKDADFLIHAAYIKQEPGQHNAYRFNVEGSKKLFELSDKYGLKKVVFISSMSAQDDAISEYGKQKLAIEKLLAAGRNVVVRPGLVVGNGGLFGQLVKLVKTKSIIPLISQGKQPLQVVALYDLVTAIDRLITMDAPGTFTIAHPEVLSYRKLYETLARQLGRRPLYMPVPFFLPRLILKLADIFKLTLPINTDNLLGLKKLRPVNTNPDLEKLHLKLDSLEQALNILRVKEWD